MRRMPTRMVSRIGLFALLSLGLGGLGQTALAQHAGCPMGGAARGAKAPGDGEGKAALRGARGDDLGLRGARMLDLSEQQVEAIRKLRDEGRKAGTALQKEMLRLRHELRGEMIKDEPALARAQELTRRIGELRTQFQEKRLEQRLAARKVLTAEQRDRLLLQRSEGGRRCGPMMKSGMHGRGFHAPGARPMGCVPGHCGPGMGCVQGHCALGHCGSGMACAPGQCGPAGCVGRCDPAACHGQAAAAGGGAEALSAPGCGGAAECPPGCVGCDLFSWFDGPEGTLELDPGGGEEEGGLFW